MDKILNKEILRLSLPSILANLTIPVVGLVDTAVAGHLHSSDGWSIATFIGAISVGAVLFNLIYWNFGFLRTGTGGLTAQAFGRGDTHACAAICVRALALAITAAAIVLILQFPFIRLALICVQASPEVEELARQYFLIRIWAAPATLSLMAFSGWFVGMQDSVSSMWKDIVVSGVNIFASLFLARGAGSWEGLGFAGVAMGTVVAQYSGLAYCILVCVFKYGRTVFAQYRLHKLRQSLKSSELSGFFRMNANLFGRSVFFTIIYIGYTLIAATFGDNLLACSSIMMQMLMLFSYFTDGFAYAAEALTGRFIGAEDPVMMHRSIKYTFVWSMSIAIMFIGVYILLGTPLLKLLTDDATVVESCRPYLPWLVLMPPLGCAAFTWDGVYLGATDSRGVRNAMMGAALAFFGVWFVLNLFRNLDRMHILMASYFAHLAVRTVYLSIRYGRMRDYYSKE